MMKRLWLAALFASACAHGPALESRQAAPGDDRAVVVEFWASWCGPCHTFDREYLPDPAVQQALAHVRFVRYDVDSIAGGSAYGRLVDLPQKRVPMFLGVVDDRVVHRLIGLPSSKERLVAFLYAVGALGGGESTLTADLESHPGDVSQLVRAARWYAARGRRAEAASYYRQLVGNVAASPEVRAEADWKRAAWSRKGTRRDPRAPLEFAIAHPGTSFGDAALDIIAVVKELSGDEVGRALRSVFEAVRDDPAAVNNLTYQALAAHQYELALEIAQQAVRMRRDAAAFDTLAEVHYYRQDAAMAVQLGERAAALDPSNDTIRHNLDRFRRADGEASGPVELARFRGYYWLPRFYGDAD